MKFLTVLSVFLGVIGSVHAEETMREKAQATANSAARAAKKGAHRIEEAACGNLTGNSKAECMAQKAKHRLKEGRDEVVDKAKEINNAVDSDKHK